MFRFAIVSKSYHVRDDRCGQAGFDALAAAAHKHGMPVTWVINPAGAVLLRDRLERCCREFGDEVAMEFQLKPEVFGLDANSRGRVAALATDLSPFNDVEKCRSILLEDRDAIHRTLPWAEVETVGRGGFRTEALIRAMEEEDFRGLWGFCWNQAEVDGISDRGTPWGVWYASHDCQKRPASYTGSVTAYEWISRDLTPAFHRNDPCKYAIEPDGVIEVLYGGVDPYRAAGEPGRAWFRSVIEQYRRNEPHNAWVPYVFQEETAQLDPTFGIKKPEVSLAMQKLTAEILDAAAEMQLEACTLGELGRQYRDLAPGGRSTASAMIYDDTVPANIPYYREGGEPFRPLLFYYNADAQAVYELGGTRPLRLYDYTNAPAADVHSELAPAARPPEVVGTERRDETDGSVTVTAEVTAAAAGSCPIPVWGDFSDCRPTGDVRIVEDVCLVFPARLEAGTQQVQLGIRSGR